MGISIREFNLHDYPTVFQLWKDTNLEILPGDELEGVKLKLTRDPDLFLVAEENNQIIGSVMGSWDGRRGWIWHLAVRAGHQRQGIGAVLVKKVEEKLIVKGAKRVLAFVLTENQRSLSFFTNAGYSDSQEDMKVMRKDLTTAQNQTNDIAKACDC